MAQWKKIIVSGSDAELNSLNVDNGVTGSLQGNATSASTVNITNTATDNASYNLAFVTGSSGNQAIRVDNNQLAWNPSTNTLTIGEQTTTGVTGSLAFTALDGGANFNNLIKIVPPILEGVLENTTVNLTLPSATGTIALISDIAANANLSVSGSTQNSTVNLATQALTIQGARPAVSTTVAGNAVVSVNVRDASGDDDGLISTGSQSFAGEKQFLGNIVVGTATERRDIVFNTVDAQPAPSQIILRPGNDLSVGNITVTIPQITGTIVVTEGAQTINGVKTFSDNVIIGGDLTVQGDVTTLNTTNLLVEDRYILLNSGSAGGVNKGGIVVDGGGGVGKAFILGETSGRWGFTGSLAQNATTATPDAFAAAVVTSDIVEYQKVGNIRIDEGTGEIFIYA